MRMPGKAFLSTCARPTCQLGWGSGQQGVSSTPAEPPRRSRRAGGARAPPAEHRLCRVPACPGRLRPIRTSRFWRDASRRAPEQLLTWCRPRSRPPAPVKRLAKRILICDLPGRQSCAVPPGQLQSGHCSNICLSDFGHWVVLCCRQGSRPSARDLAARLRRCCGCCASHQMEPTCTLKTSH